MVAPSDLMIARFFNPVVHFTRRHLASSRSGNHQEAVFSNQLHLRLLRFDFYLTVPIGYVKLASRLKPGSLANLFRDYHTTCRIDGSNHGNRLPLPKALRPYYCAGAHNAGSWKLGTLIGI